MSARAQKDFVVWFKMVLVQPVLEASACACLLPTGDERTLNNSEGTESSGPCCELRDSQHGRSVRQMHRVPATVFGRCSGHRVPAKRSCHRVPAKRSGRRVRAKRSEPDVGGDVTAAPIPADGSVAVPADGEGWT